MYILSRGKAFSCLSKGEKQGKPLEAKTDLKCFNLVKIKYETVERVVVLGPKLNIGDLKLLLSPSAGWRV